MGFAGRMPKPSAAFRPVAVGTLIAERPPHRTVRAAFPHTAPTSGLTAGPVGILAYALPTPVTWRIRHGVRSMLCRHAIPLASALRSTGSAADLSAAFAGFTATMASSDFPRPCIIGYGSSPSRCGPTASLPPRSDVGSPRFRRAPFARDVLFDPGGVDSASHDGTDHVAFGSRDNLRPHEKDISWLNHTPHATAVYASRPSLPPARATLASRRLARPYLGWTSTSGSRQLPGAPLPILRATN